MNWIDWKTVSDLIINSTASNQLKFSPFANWTFRFFRKKEKFQTSEKNVDAKEKQNIDLWILVHWGSLGRWEKLYASEPFQNSSTKLARHQSFTITCLTRLCHREIRMATLLLVLDQWRHSIFERIFTFATRNRTSYT